MKIFRKLMCSFLPITVLISCMLLVSCGSEKTSSSDVPATIQNPVKESDLTSIHLSESAEQRLGIDTEIAAVRDVPREMAAGGEIIAVPGGDVTVKAPVSASVLYATEGKGLVAGGTIAKGQELMRLLVLPPEQSLLSAEDELAVKQAEYTQAQEQYTRTEQLLRDKAASEKDLEEARTRLALAQGALSTAQKRMQLLNGTDLDAGSSELIVRSPFDGVLHDVYVASGQVVNASTPLFRMVSQTPVWVKVSVYAGDLHSIDNEKPVGILLSGNSEQYNIVSGEPVIGPPSSNPANATSDLYYRIENTDNRFRVGQKVSVRVPMKVSEEYPVVPYAAIVYDMYGGSWLYVKEAPLTYIRKRISVAYIVDDLAVISRGVTAGEEVVVAGTAELFGTEFGEGK